MVQLHERVKFLKIKKRGSFQTMALPFRKKVWQARREIKGWTGVFLLQKCREESSLAVARCHLVFLRYPARLGERSQCSHSTSLRSQTTGWQYLAQIWRLQRRGFFLETSVDFNNLASC
jgi:hypothetical protein